MDGTVNLVDRQLYMRLDVDALSGESSAQGWPETLMFKGPWAEPSIHIEALTNDLGSDAGDAPQSNDKVDKANSG